MEETILSKDKTQFRIELILALMITGLACAAGFSNYLTASNDLFPLTSDAMGHMAKVRYLSECLSRGEFPSWFPYWYNGSAFTQYYPPLSYWLMAPIFLMVQNAMLTYKIYCFTMIFIGGIGVWYFCRHSVGRWCGLFGMAVYVLQPYILLSFYGAGVLAQGPIIALTPWYLYIMLSIGKQPDAKKFILCTFLCVLMILSHPMTIFMICLCMLTAALVCAYLRKITFLNFFLMIFSIGFAGILTAFWSLIGVTELETPGIPYLLAEAVLKYTADLTWFTTVSSGFFYFAIPVTAGSVAATLLFGARVLQKKTKGEEQYRIFFCILLTFVTIIFSFGLRLPLFQYLPLAESYVPGRILSLTSGSGAILCAYLIYIVASSASRRKVGIKLALSLLCMAIIGGTILNMNPLLSSYLIKDDREFKEMISKNNIEDSNFEKGRYTDIGLIDSNETYFPLSYDYNITFGWNIEGTPHNQFFWNQSIAQDSKNYAFIAKELAYWNVRSLYIIDDFQSVVEELNKKYDFEWKFTRGNRKLYVSDNPSSYFLEDQRNALLFGPGSPGLAMEFPYLIHDQRNHIDDYSIAELEGYRLIYLCEPVVDSFKEKEEIETMVTELIDRGVTVLIEPASTGGYQLFDVAVSEVVLEDSPVIKKQIGSKIVSTEDNIKVDENMNYGRTMFGLDTIYYKLVQNGGRLENEMIGTKRTGDGEVVFIGHLSQYLKAVYARNWGAPESESGYPECSDVIKALFTDIFKAYGVNTNFWPEPYPVEKAEWNYKGVDFEYSSEKAREMTLSVTYTPRWKATLDGNPIEIGQKENLIILDLPAGDHEVKLVYGLTKYGKAGYILSLAGLLFFVLFLKYYGIIIYRFRQILIRISKFLQLYDAAYDTEDIDTGEKNDENVQSK